MAAFIARVACCSSKERAASRTRSLACARASACSSGERVARHSGLPINQSKEAVWRASRSGTSRGSWILANDTRSGAPGIFSARWSGRHGDDAANLELLLAQLADIPAERRGAAFVCAAAIARPFAGPQHNRTERGELRGSLLTAPRGDGGFGYDPILVPEGLQSTCAELAPEEKNAISHRGRAMRALLPHLLTALDPAAVPD